MPSSNPPPPSDNTQAHPGRCLLALLYDSVPVIAIWWLIAVIFSIGYWQAGHDLDDNIPPFSATQWGLWLSCWLATGVYATVSWRLGGQTIGMRSWNLYLTSSRQPLSWLAVWTRFIVGTVSLLAVGAGFWWAIFHRHKRTWHDRASGTYITRQSKPR